MLNDESRTKNAGKGIFWGFAYRIVSIILPFVSRTIIIYYLGVEYTGLGGLFTSILSVLSLAELGIGHALVFGMYKPIAEKEISKINAYMGFYRKCYRIIGTIILFIGLLLLPFLPYLISGDIPNNINLYILYIIYLCNTVISYFLFAYKSSILTANQRTDLTSKISLLCLIGYQSAQIVLLLLFRNYYFYAVVLPISTVVNNLIINYVVKKQYPEIDCKGKMDKKEIDSIKEIVGGIIFQKIGFVVLSSVDTIIISAFLGLRILGIYNNYYYIISSLFGFLTVINSSVIPSVGNSIQTKDLESNYSLFRLYSFLYNWIVIFCFTCLLTLYQPFMRIWVGKTNMLDTTMVFLLAFYFVIWKIIDPVYVFRDASGCWKKYKTVPLIAAALNLVTNIILVQFIGLYGIVLSTIISFLIIYIPFFSYPLFKDYFNSKQKYVKYLFEQFEYIIVAVFVAGATYYLCSFLPNDNISGFVIKASMCSLVPNFMLFSIFHRCKDFKLTALFLKNNIITKFKS